MVCVYSVRAKQRPTVSSPVGWDEVEAVDAGAADPLVFEMHDVLERRPRALRDAPFVRKLPAPLA